MEVRYKRFVRRSACYNWLKGSGKSGRLDLSNEEKVNFKNSINAVKELFIAAKDRSKSLVYLFKNYSSSHTKKLVIT